MKFVDTFTEEEKKKLIKKGRLIYSLLKNGTITRSDGVKFSYELGNDIHIKVVKGEIELFTVFKKVVEHTYCPINEYAMEDLIQRRFEKHNIKIDIYIPKSIEIVKYQGKKPWELNESEDKEKKKVHNVHKALRKGVVNVSGERFRYELPEEYTFHVVQDTASIRFKFYNHDLGQNFSGLGLPLRVWRIEDGKDVLVNGRLTKDDVSDICYGDEYLMNTKSGVDYINVKNKVRNKYRNFDINCIMTTPASDTITINESEDKYEERRQKQIKKGKTVYKALRKGRIKPNDPDQPYFSYELSDNFGVDTNNLGIVIYTDGVKLKHLNKACERFDPPYLTSRIRNKFKHFGIVIDIPYITDDNVEEFNVEPINEGRVGNVGFGITEKELKKVNAVYKALKKGFFKYNYNSIYGYELPNDYYARRDELGNVCIVITGHNDQQPKFLSKIKFGEDELVKELEPNHRSLIDWVKDKVIKKFKQFDIKFIF